MELIVISDTKLKVILTREDMELFSLDCEHMEEEERTRPSMEALFREVKRISGFDAVGARVLVQVWRDLSGGCELYVTKLSPGEGQEERKGGMRRLRILYSFENLDRLTAVCRVLESRAYRRPSDVYLGEDGRWYLVLETPEEEEEVGPLSVLEEYGHRHPLTALTLLSEHGRLIRRGGAVAAFSSLA